MSSTPLKTSKKYLCEVKLYQTNFKMYWNRATDLPASSNIVDLVLVHTVGELVRQVDQFVNGVAALARCQRRIAASLADAAVDLKLRFK